MYLSLVGLCLLAVIGLYFYNNPMGHSRRFMVRRFINWFPLGMTYAFLYMGRYNLNVSKNALGALMSKEDLGTIFAVGTLVYGFSFVINGPVVDKIGGKKGIIIAALGASVANMALGALTYLVETGQLKVKLVVAFSTVYALNMYFQSYGAVSIIKVKAYWFHVRERGIFSAIFGTLISFGFYFAFDWGQAIVEMAKARPEGKLNWLHGLIQRVFALEARPVDATWAVFFIPAVLLVIWSLLDAWLIKDTPEEAQFPHFDTHDASSGEMHLELSTMDLLKRVFASRLMLLIAAIGLTTGVLRNGIMQWYFVFAQERSAAFAAADLKDVKSLAAKVGGKAEGVSAFLSGQLDGAGREALARFQTPNANAGQMERALVETLNRVVTNQAIYQEDRFQGVALRPGTRKLLGQNPRGQDLERLNRLLLEDAYPRELASYPTYFLDHWGLLLCVFGILGGFAGMVSDKFFQSRRGPPVAICSGLMFVLTVVMAVCLFAAPLVVGWACVLITMAAIGEHALTSGTAAADFGGRKATATCSGIVDGFVYLGGGLQSYSIGRLAGQSWYWWPLFLMPFAVIGGMIALRIWHELPAATRRYIAEVEGKA
ncbi:MAG: MFS transporter [Verrucomicrobiota bacterium]|jgi:sugar phosphate permease